MEKGTYICSDCERLERVEQGYDPSLGRFIWQCRHCTRQYEEDDFHAAEKHGNRCFSMLARRQWSCVCNGQMANTKQMMATQCTKCELWFHYGCKSQYALGGRKDVCASCEKSHDTSSVDQPESERPMSRALKAAAVDKELAGLDGFHHDEFGTLSDKRVHVKVSTLGEHSGLGLFAAVKIRTGETVRSPPSHRTSLGPEVQIPCTRRLHACTRRHTPPHASARPHTPPRARTRLRAPAHASRAHIS